MSDFATKLDIAGLQAQIATLEQRLVPLSFTALPHAVQSTNVFTNISLNNSMVTPNANVFNQISGTVWWERVGGAVTYNGYFSIDSVGSATAGGGRQAQLTVDLTAGSLSANDGRALIPWAQAANVIPVTCVMSNFVTGLGGGHFDQWTNCVGWMDGFPLITIMMLPGATDPLYATGNIINFTCTYQEVVPTA